MVSDVTAYKKELFNSVFIDAESNSVFPEESFFEYVTELLSDAGILENVEYCPFRNSHRGIRIDGLSWNELEKTIYGIVVDFSYKKNEIETITQSEIKDIGKRVTRFFESAGNDGFLQSLEVTDPGRIAAAEINHYLEDTIKFRVVVLTDRVISDRVRDLSIDPILGVPTSVEIWDLERLQALEESGSEYEPFTVDLEELGGTIRALPANLSEKGFSTYLAVMPASLLSNIYDRFGQRLLESNVRTFLDFRGGPNRGMRKSLVTEPEHFFAYNNGITVTSTKATTKVKEGQLIITALENMQIVNGGQTTATIYFSPREKGGIKGVGGTYLYSGIDLSKVYVQMKLTVIERDEEADKMKANIARFANLQNAIQQSDLVSNHPFHLNVEKRSRKQLMPVGESGLSTKWFYERTRGQYSTQLRALSPGKKRKHLAEYPKKQVFTKTDLAKYENTWRMNPHIVKKGAQANLKSLGVEIIKEYEKDEEAFGPSFFKDLVAKMILFREVDANVLTQDWYKEERGFKAEIVTYSIALMRHVLTEEKKDIDLDAIYNRQGVSEKLLDEIVDLARKIREKITDPNFTGGVTNPSEFSKSERGWKMVKSMRVDTSSLGAGDIISENALKKRKKEKDAVDKDGRAISGIEYVMAVTSEEWRELADFGRRIYPESHKNVSIPTACASISVTGKVPSDSQMKLAKEIRESAINEGFEFVAL